MKPQWDTTAHLLELFKVNKKEKKKKISNAGKKVEQWDFFLLVLIQNGTATLEYSLEASYNIKNICTIKLSTPMLRYHPREIKMCLDKKQYSIIYYGFLQNHQKLETLHMPINRWMDKQIMLCSYNEIQLNKKKQITDTIM